MLNKSGCIPFLCWAQPKWKISSNLIGVSWDTWLLSIKLAHFIDCLVSVDQRLSAQGQCECTWSWWRARIFDHAGLWNWVNGSTNDKGQLRMCSQWLGQGSWSNDIFWKTMIEFTKLAAQRSKKSIWSKFSEQPVTPCKWGGKRGTRPGAWAQRKGQKGVTRGLRY